MRPPGRNGGRIEDRLARGGPFVELLRAPAALFSVVARARGRLYDRGLLPAYRVGLPVVSVGNLTAGGTGKTPAVAWVVRRLAAHGARAGVLSRGYKAAAGGENDEARMLARLLPGVPHVQQKDRVAGAGELERLGVDVVVLDDGFQHRRLVRDLDLVLVDATRPWGLPSVDGKGPVRALLPRGLLREPPRALRRASALVVTRCDAVGPEDLARLERELSELAPDVPLARARHAPSTLWRGGPGREATAPGSLAGLEVDLVSGIGNPRAFEDTVRGLGARVVRHLTFPDHHAYAARDLASLGERPVVTTAKDAVKLEGHPLRPWVLDVELAIEQGEDALDALLRGLPEGSARAGRRALHEGLHG